MMPRLLSRVAPGAALLVLSAAAALAAVYPKPNPEQAFAEMKVFDAQGRPWREAREDWAGAQRRVAEDPAWAEWLKTERAEVDRWIAKHHDRVEWVAGWSHDGVSPKDGSRVIWTDQIPREEVKFFKSPSDPQIEITDKLMAWWVVTFRGRNVDTMVRAARLYRLTGDNRYAAWVAGQMDFYSDNLLRWPKGKGGADARLFWQTLTEGSSLVKFTEAVRLIKDHVPADQLARWHDKFFAHEVGVLDGTLHTIHNIATWQRCASAQVALLFNDEKLWREAIDGQWGLRQQMAQGITSDYLWHEQSLGYNGFVVRAVTTLFTTAGVYGRAAELAPEMAVAENLMLAPVYLRFPNGQLPNPADSGGINRAPDREVFADTYRVFPTAIGLQAVAGRRDWDTLIDPPAAPPAERPLPEVHSRNLESTRMAVLKSGPWQVFFHYGQLAPSHNHHEALNYAAFFENTDITHDPGTVGYGSPLHANYYTQGLNHNVPMVNGNGELPPQAGKLVSYSENPARVSAEQPRYQPHAHASRTLAIEGNALVDTASVATDNGPQKLGLTLHLQGTVKLVGAAFAPDANFAKDRPKAFSYWRNPEAVRLKDRAELEVTYKDGRVMHVVVTAPGEFTLWHGSSPDVPPRRRDSLYLELASPASSATFTTTFTPAAAK